MALVRKLILREMYQASTAQDEISSAKFLRLAFHDCLKYPDGSGGCDGCINWMDVGTTVGGKLGNGRVEDREFQDHERRPSNNGLQEVVAFLESIYTMDLGKTWDSGCWKNPATITGGEALAGTRKKAITVKSIEECQEHCRKVQGCVYFTVPALKFLGATGPCRLFSKGTQRNLGRGPVHIIVHRNHYGRDHLMHARIHA